MLRYDVPFTRESLQALNRRLKDATQINACREELESRLIAKDDFLWRMETSLSSFSDFVSAGLGNQLAQELDFLEKIIDALKNGDIARATSIIDAYASQLASLDK